MTIEEIRNELARMLRVAEGEAARIRREAAAFEGFRRMQEEAGAIEYEGGADAIRHLIEFIGEGAE